MKRILLSLILIMGLTTVNASQFNISNFSYKFLAEDTEFPEETLIKLGFDVEVQDLIAIIDSQIALVELYSDNLLIQGHAVNSSMHNDILLIELRDAVAEIKSLKVLKQRLEYYLVVANHRLLD